MKHFRIKTTAALSILIFSTSTLRAQEAAEVGIKLTNSELFPTIRIEYLQKDNLDNSPSAPSNISTYVLKPELTWVANRRLVSLTGNYSGAFSNGNLSDLNYQDHNISLEADIDLTKRNRSNIFLNVRRGHDSVGAGVLTNADTDSNEIATFTDSSLRLSHTYGARSAKGNVGIGLFVQQKKYSANKSDFSDSNLSRVRPSVEFLLQVSGLTRFLVGVSADSVSYENTNSDRDDLSLFTGLRFYPGGKLSGGFRIGIVDTDYQEFNDKTITYVRSDIRYRVSAKSTVNLFVSRRIDDIRSRTTEQGPPPVLSVARANWNYALTSRISTSLGASTRLSETQCTTPDITTNQVSLELNYQLRSWIQIGLRTGMKRRSSRGCSESDIDSNADNYRQYDSGLFVRINPR